MNPCKCALLSDGFTKVGGQFHYSMGALAVTSFLNHFLLFRYAPSVGVPAKRYTNRGGISKQIESD